MSRVHVPLQNKRTGAFAILQWFGPLTYCKWTHNIISVARCIAVMWDSYRYSTRCNSYKSPAHLSLKFSRSCWPWGGDERGTQVCSPAPRTECCCGWARSPRCPGTRDQWTCWKLRPSHIPRSRPRLPARLLDFLGCGSWWPATCDRSAALYLRLLPAS